MFAALARPLTCVLAFAALGMPAATQAAADAVTELESAGFAVTRSANGTARFVAGQQTTAAARTRGGDAEARARDFVDRFGAAFGVGGRAALRTTRASGRDAVGMEHVRLQQEVDGVPLAGGEMTVHLRGDVVTAVLARTVADLGAVDTTPTLSAAAAEAAARGLAAEWTDGPFCTFSNPRLELFNRALLDGAGASATRLAWFVRADSDARMQYIWVDAHDGTVLRHFNNLPSALVRHIYDANNAGQYGVLVREEGDGPTGNVQVDNAYDFSGDTYDYYATEHGRDSFDNAGGVLVNVVRSCPIDLCSGLCPCPNAFNAIFFSFFGNGWVTDDIVAHEWTHAVTGYAAGLLYTKQSGALNESFSDIFGETVDLINGAGTDTPAVRWRVSEDLNGSGIRDMMNPSLFNDPGKTSDPQVVCASFDDFGVHSNSGIPNHAFALMVDGGTYNGFTITGIGLTKAGKIQYRSLNDYLVSTSTLADNASALAQSCTDLIGTAGITGADCVEVQKAIDAVEMGGPWPCDPCGIGPRGTCRPAAVSSLLWEQDGGDDKFIWKWVKGQSTAASEFGDPVDDADYALCVYTGAGGTLLSEIDVPSSPFLWQQTGSGFKYKNPAGAPDGATKIVLKTSTDDKAKALVKGAGAALPDPTLGSLAAPVRVQLVNLSNLLCWEGSYDADDIKANAPGLFKAKAKN